MRKNIIKKVLLLLLSTIFIATACSFFNISGYGGDPVFVFNMSLANLLNIKLGTAIIITNIIFGIIFLSINYRAIGIGTIVGIFCVGPTTDLLLKYVFNFGIESLYLKAVLFYIGIIILAFGISFFILADLGFAPVEGIMSEVSKRCKKLTIGRVRLIIDTTTFTLALIIGAYKLFENNIIFPIICILGATFLTGPVVDIIYTKLKKIVK